jgi:hypothetical protein
MDTQKKMEDGLPYEHRFSPSKQTCFKSASKFKDHFNFGSFYTKNKILIRVITVSAQSQQNSFLPFHVSIEEGYEALVQNKFVCHIRNQIVLPVLSPLPAVTVESGTVE